MLSLSTANYSKIDSVKEILGNSKGDLTLNKNSTGSNYRSRAKRTRKNKTALIILQAAAAFLIILSGILYSIYAAQNGSEQKQTAAVNVPASNEPAENAASTNDGPTGNEQIGSSNAPDITVCSRRSLFQ